MPRRIPLLLVALVALGTAAACSDGQRRLAEPSGPVFRLNPDRWPDAAPPAGRTALR
ncbi:hypothetical protein RQ765_15125 [Roseomonas mucosa]|uniref:hypothetical protein n=1 Tax=Roseomonas mucosa TaxID=207340 RepID=UPI0028CBE093|nr:hypothetical protein [Roseomonas mucosa]MDT8315412.1 hypothetical protein [Roseomonas mucosa]MDT8361673.1 hypothetical protein [Roseomonas mucosa]